MMLSTKEKLQPTAITGYLDAFADKYLSNHFLTYYSINPDKSIAISTYTRGEFLILASSAKQFLESRGISQGDHICHFFSSNTVEDLAFRLASVFIGCVPVTINWDADPQERVLYKINVTKCKLVLHDDTTNSTTLAYLNANVISTEVTSIVNVITLLKNCLSSSTKDGGAMVAAMMMAEGAASSQNPTPLQATRITIFTSGTTGNPKGVKLTYSNYETNRATFEQFLEIEQDPTILLSTVVVNPLHHTNSTSITDWTLRRPNAQLHLFQRYTTPYWNILAQLGHDEIAVKNQEHRLVAPAVSRHFDFLESLIENNKLINNEAWMKKGLNQIDFLIGSAPVGPQTVARLQRFTGKLPLVRFGSTETTLQVMGTPRHLSEAARLISFQKGWNHTNPKDVNELQPGYYIGQQHTPHTQVMVVESTSIEDGALFLRPCTEGVPGYIITRGGHVMKGYVDNDEATNKALFQIEIDWSSGSSGSSSSSGCSGGINLPWYLNLGDVGFWLMNESNHCQDIYWMSRESALLIRGGSNYAYEQINTELKEFLIQKMGMSESVIVAVIGLKVNSEHEDDCCVTIEMKESEDGNELDLNEVGEQFIRLTNDKKNGVSKGAKPNMVRFGKIPKNFKGAILVKELKKDWKTEIARRNQSHVE